MRPYTTYFLSLMGVLAPSDTIYADRPQTFSLRATSTPTIVGTTTAPSSTNMHFSLRPGAKTKPVLEPEDLLLPLPAKKTQLRDYDLVLDQDLALSQEAQKWLERMQRQENNPQLQALFSANKTPTGFEGLLSDTLRNMLLVVPVIQNGEEYTLPNLTDDEILSSKTGLVLTQPVDGVPILLGLPIGDTTQIVMEEGNPTIKVNHLKHGDIEVSKAKVEKAKLDPESFSLTVLGLIVGDESKGALIPGPGNVKVSAGVSLNRIGGTFEGSVKGKYAGIPFNFSKYQHDQEAELHAQAVGSVQIDLDNGALRFVGMGNQNEYRFGAYGILHLGEDNSRAKRRQQRDRNTRRSKR